MQATWNWTNTSAEETASLSVTHPLPGKRHGRSTRTPLAAANGLGTAFLKLASTNTSSSVPVQGTQAATPTFPAGDNWAAAREAFLTRHGPRAVFPRRPRLSRELRKALLATEMAAWEAT